MADTYGCTLENSAKTQTRVPPYRPKTTLQHHPTPNNGLCLQFTIGNLS